MSGISKVPGSVERIITLIFDGKEVKYRCIYTPPSDRVAQGGKIEENPDDPMSSSAQRIIDVYAQILKQKQAPDKLTAYITFEDTPPGEEPKHIIKDISIKTGAKTLSLNSPEVRQTFIVGKQETTVKEAFQKFVDAYYQQSFSTAVESNLAKKIDEERRKDLRHKNALRIEKISEEENSNTLASGTLATPPIK